jgi:phosphoglycolate phosphatase-like HAD superfamily hydrolase
MAENGRYIAMRRRRRQSLVSIYAATRRVFVFDLDGPLLDVSERYYRLYRDLVSAQDLSPLPKATYWRLKRRRVPEEAIFRRSGGTKNEEMEYAQLRLSRIESKAYLQYDKMWVGVPAMLRYLHRRALLLLATARRRHRLLEWQLGKLRIRSQFHRVLSIPPRSRSPWEAKATRVRGILGRSPYVGWFIGDTEVDVSVGRLLGLQTVAVAFGIRDTAALRLFNPDTLLATPGELVSWVRSTAP